jgi:hypothetical protein
MNLDKQILEQQQVVNDAQEEFLHFNRILEEKRKAALRAKSVLCNMQAKVYYES